MINEEIGKGIDNAKRVASFWDRHSKAFSVVFMLICSYIVYLIMKGQVDESNERAKNCEIELTKINAEIRVLAFKTEQAKQVTQEQRVVVDSLNSAVQEQNPAIQEYNSSFKRIEQQSKKPK